MLASEIEDLLPLKPIWFHLLLAVASGHRHAYAIRRAIEEDAANGVRTWPATLHRGLSGLTEEGLVEDDPRQFDGPHEGRGRRVYRITDRGRRVLAAEIERLEELVARARTLGAGREEEGSPR